MKRQHIILPAIVISLLLLQLTFAALPRYEITDLGTLGGDDSGATAINDAGQVVGWSYMADGLSSHAFLWDPINGMIDLGTIPGHYYSSAGAINDYGVVVGCSDPYGDQPYPFIWDPANGMRYLDGLFDEGLALGINNAGQVVGWAWWQAARAFLWDSTNGIIDLGPGRAYAINNTGQVVGNGLGGAFLWDEINGMRYLGTLGGNNSLPWAINDLGQVVGWSETTPGDWQRHAFFWDSNTGMTNLGPGHAWAINNAGQVVGSLRPTIPSGSAFYWDIDNGMVILDCLTRGRDINNRGQIVGEGITDAGQYHAFLMTPVPPKVIYVDDDANGNNDGSSWADAFNYLQDALTAAWSGDEIRVAHGIYKPDQGAGITLGDREATFQLINGVTIKGGYAGYGQPDPNARDIKLYETILTGDLLGNDDPDDSQTKGENSYHVVTGSGTNETAILDGFSITAGKANGSWLLHHYDGGGLSNYAGSPTIGNCTFSGNSAGWYGGGIYNEGSSPTLFNCTIRDNAAGGSGSGMCNLEGSNPTLTNCTFSWNVGLSYHDSFGVGMYNYKSNPILSNCAFTGNSGSLGAGMYNYYSNPTLTSCTFTGNTVHEGGGGMGNIESSPTLINCTFSGNWCDWYGVGGMESFSNSTPTLTNCILWNDMPGEISGPAVVTYSDVQGGWPGTGNIDADPCFVSPGYWNTNGTPDKYWDDFWVDGDYHLLPGSPCIDTGDPNYVAEPNETDLDGRPRVIGGRIDMGAYEYRPSVPAEVRIVPRTINLASKGKWITAFLWLPEDYNVADIDPNSVFLEGEIKPEEFSVDQQKQVAVLRFSREEVQPILEVGDIDLTITGQLTDGTVFEGTDIIRVLNKAGQKSPE